LFEPPKQSESFVHAEDADATFWHEEKVDFAEKKNIFV